MASCFICGVLILKGAEIRRTVHTGSSVGGFSISSNVVLNLIVNSLISKRRQSVRSYYSTRTVCSSCDTVLAMRERRKNFRHSLIRCHLCAFDCGQFPFSTLIREPQGIEHAFKGKTRFNPMVGLRH
jgi:hypothetical protein